jgi:hypothetical protein
LLDDAMIAEQQPHRGLDPPGDHLGTSVALAEAMDPSLKAKRPLSETWKSAVLESPSGVPSDAQIAKIVAEASRGGLSFNDCSTAAALALDAARREAVANFYQDPSMAQAHARTAAVKLLIQQLQALNSGAMRGAYIGAEQGIVPFPALIRAQMIGVAFGLSGERPTDA